MITWLNDAEAFAFFFLPYDRHADAWSWMVVVRGLLGTLRDGVRSKGP